MSDLQDALTDCEPIYEGEAGHPPTFIGYKVPEWLALRIHAALEAERSSLDAALQEARETIEAMSGDAADLIDLMDEAAALRTALGHVLVRTHDSGCGTCDAARALLTADHELPSRSTHPAEGGR